MTIAAILSGKGQAVMTIPADVKVSDAVAMLASKRIGAIPVTDGEQVVGIFSERDVIYALAEQGADALNHKVSERMTAPAIGVSPGDSVLGALSLMTRRRIRHLPVLDDGRLVGFVSIGDLVKYRIERIEAEADAMRDYIQQA